MMSYTKVSGSEEELRAAGCKAGGIGIGDADYLTLAEGRRLKADATEAYLKTETPPAGTYRTSHGVTSPTAPPEMGRRPDARCACSMCSRLSSQVKSLLPTQPATQ